MPYVAAAKFCYEPVFVALMLAANVGNLGCIFDITALYGCPESFRHRDEFVRSYQNR